MSTDHDTNKDSLLCCSHGSSLITSDIDIKISECTKGEDSWLVQGNGEAPYLNCSQICSYIITRLKIDCEHLSCPTCGKKENLIYEVYNLKMDNTFFNFYALILCKKCNQKISFKKIIKNLDIKHLKISIYEIEIERR